MRRARAHCDDRYVSKLLDFVIAVLVIFIIVNVIVEIHQIVTQNEGEESFQGYRLAK